MTGKMKEKYKNKKENRKKKIEENRRNAKGGSSLGLIPNYEVS